MKTSRLALWISLSSMVAVAVACSSSDESGPGDTGSTPDGSSSSNKDGSAPPTPFDASVPPTVEAACTSLANAICSKVESCTPFGLAALYVDLATCKDRQRLACKASASAAAQKATADQLDACASSIPALDCNEVTTLELGPACTIAGSRKNGEPCGYNAECESSFCAIGSDQNCGSCAAPTTEGQACTNESCSAGFACSEVDTKCYKPLAGKVGDSCARQSDCDVAHGAACNPGTKKCIELKLAEDGKCGTNVSGTSYATCPGGAACSSQVGGTCAAIAKDGESCGDNGPSCYAPARCVSGTCALPSPACK